MMRGLQWLGLVVCWVGLSACGTADEVSREDFGEQVVQALCARATRCGAYASASDCEQDLRAQGYDVYLGLGTRYDDALASGQLHYDAEQAARCVETIREDDCQLPFLPERVMRDGAEYHPACRLFVARTAARSCEQHHECGEQAYCGVSVSSECTRSCQPRGLQGEPAVGPHACAPGLRYTELTGICERPVGENEDCLKAGEPEQAALFRPCEEGLTCTNVSRLHATCQRHGKEGNACETTDPFACGPFLACIEGQCTPFTRRGEACTAHGLVDTLDVEDVYVNECQRDLFCDADVGTRGECIPRRQSQQECRASEECAAGLLCRGANPDSGQRGVCTAAPGFGAECDDEALPCQGLYSCHPVTRRCVPTVRLGERCGDEARCSESLCVEGRCVGFGQVACR